MRNNSLFLFITIASIGICCHGSQNGESQLKLDLVGEVFRDTYVNVVMPSESQISYCVKVSITNESIGPFVFDNIEAYFFAERGEPLIQKVDMRTKKPDQDIDAAFESGLINEIVISSGETNNLHNLFFSTNGYTTSLIDNARGGVLSFAVIFKLRGNIVAGPYIGVLPNWRTLETLPGRWEVLINPYIEGYRLDMFDLGVSSTTGNMRGRAGRDNYNLCDISEFVGLKFTISRIYNEMLCDYPAI